MSLDTTFKSPSPPWIARIPGPSARRTGRRRERLVRIRLQRELISCACRGIPTTYRHLIRSIAPVADADAALVRAVLERLMDEDTIAARPYAAALVVSPQAGGRPEPWFFSKARLAGRLASLADELEMLAFHARELRRAASYYRVRATNAPDAHLRPGAGNEGAVKMLLAKDVMTPDAVTVAPDAPVRAVAEILVSLGISGISVVDNGVLAGIVTEGDLLHRAEIGTAKRPASWWSRFFGNRTRLAAMYRRDHSRRVGDVMTRSVVTVDEFTSIAEIADLLDQKKIRQVPVLRGGKVVGMVSRASVVRAVALTASLPGYAGTVDDDTIHQQILSAMLGEAWASGSATNITVRNGVVTLRGTFDSGAERDAVRVLCENVPGVQEVEDLRVVLIAPVVAL